jgi:glutathione S-transferase
MRTGSESCCESTTHGAAMLKIYGSLPSRTFRCLWMLEETGVPYKWIRVPVKELRSPAYLGLNPNGKMPVIQDGPLILWESIAINLYIAHEYGGPLWPADSAGRALVYQWSFWAVNEIEPGVVAAMSAAKDREPDRADRLLGPLRVLDGVLSRRSYLLGEQLTAADINVAGILSTITATRLAFHEHGHVLRWLGKCLERPYPKQFFGVERARKIP